MEKTEISDESLWQLFETSAKDTSSQSILEVTQRAANAIRGGSPHTNSPRAGLHPQPTEEVQSLVVKDDAAEELDFTPHVLDTVLEENSKESSGLQDPKTEDALESGLKSALTNVADSPGSYPNSVKPKAKAIRESASPLVEVLARGTTPPALSREPIVVKPVQFDSPVPSLDSIVNRQNGTQANYPKPTKPVQREIKFQPITDNVTSKPDQLTGSIPGGFYVTVEKHTTDVLTNEHVTSTPHSLKASQVLVREANNPSSGEGESSSSCQSSFDIPKPAEPVSNSNVRAAVQIPSMKQGRGPNTYPNPQLMAEDVQVKHSDLSQRQRALQSITAKQADGRVHRSKYSVPVTRVTSTQDTQTGSDSSSSALPQQSASAALLSNQNITVHHELVASDFVSSLLERLTGKDGTKAPAREDSADLREIKSLENKLQSTELELNAIKQQMSLQQREDQSKLLSELVYSQRSLQNQLLSLRSTPPATARPSAGLEDILKTPAPRSRLPAAAQPEESPAGGFMEQVVRSYPSPVSPQKVPVIPDQQRGGGHSPPTRLSPVPILKNSPNRSPANSAKRRTDERKVKVEEDNSKQIRQLTEKVQRLMDEQRMDSLNVERALQREAPIDRFLSDIKLAREGGGGGVPFLHVNRDKKTKDTACDELDATFLLPEAETPSLTDQLKKKLDKLRQRQQQSEENMATVLAMRARDTGYLKTDDFVCDEDTRLHKLVRAHLDRAEADVQKQVSQIDFIPKPLQDRNVTPAQQPVKYRTAAQRLRAVQAKIDTGIARKPLRVVDKENEMEPVDLTKDDNYMRRVYGKALYHAQKRTVEKAKPDSPTRPLPYKVVSERRVRSEKIQVGRQTRQSITKASQVQNHVKPAAVKPVMPPTKSPFERNVKSKRTVATGVSEPSHFTPTTILGSGMRVQTEDPTKLVLDVLPLPSDSVVSPGSEATEKSRCHKALKDQKQRGSSRKRAAITIDKVETTSIASTEGSAKNTNNNARSPSGSGSGNSDSGSKEQQEEIDSVTSEWQESGDSTSQPPLMMTADSLDLSAVTPAVESQRSNTARSGQTHSTPIEEQGSNKKPMAAQSKGRQQKSLAAPTSQEPPPRAWEEFENDAEARGSVQEDKSRSDDIITPPTTLPGYQYRKEEQAPAAHVLQTPVTRHRDLYHTGQRQQEVGGASRYPREQWEVDPVQEKPLYDPTEMATRDWLEQRLMAKCIERMIREYPVRKPARDPTSREGKDGSPPDSVDNTLVAGAMAEGGAAQVYVNAGKTIDTEQVKRLMRECLADKIRTMLGTRETLERVPGDVMRPASQSAPVVEGIGQSGVEDKTAATHDHPFEPIKPGQRVTTPEPSPPSTPVEAPVTKRVAVTPEPSPPSTPAEIFSDVVSKPLDASLRRSTERRLGVDVRSSAGRMPSTPFDLHRQPSQQLEEDEVRIEQEVVPPTPASAAPPDTTDAGDMARSQDEKLHLSQVSLWDTLSGAHTQDSVIDEPPPFEMRYSIDTPEPTPPPSPPQAVSVQTSLTEQVLEVKLRASAADNGAQASESRQQTPVPATRGSRPQTPLRVSSAQSELIQVQPVQSAHRPDTPVQSEVIHVAPSQSEPDSPAGSASTVTDTQMNTVSEGEWILKSDGQITPIGEATLADLSLVSSEDETQPLPGVVINREAEESHSEGEIIGPTRSDPMVALLARVQETPKALKSFKYGKREEGEHLVISPSPTGSRARSEAEEDDTLRMSDLNQSSKVKKQLLPSDNNKSSSSSTGLAFADSKQVTMRPQQLQQAITSATVGRSSPNQRQTDQPIKQQGFSQPAYSVSPNKATKGSPTKRPIPGMIHSTLDNKRKSRPTSSLRTTEDFSQLSNNASASFSKTRDSVDSPDRMHTESLLRSGGYLTRTLGDTTSEISEQRRPESATLDTNQLLARTIDSQGLSTSTSTAMLDTNKLLADTLEQQADLYQRHLRQQRTTTLRSEVINEDRATSSTPYNVNESIDSVSSGGILRSSNEYTRTLSGAPNKPKQYLRFSVPTGDEDSSQPSDDMSELDF